MAIEKCGVYRSFIPATCLSVIAAALSASINGAAAPLPPAAPPTSVTVINSPSSPVPTQNVGGGAATQVGQFVSKLVLLNCLDFSVAGACSTTPFGPAFTVPAGQALVITDVQ